MRIPTATSIPRAARRAIPIGAAAAALVASTTLLSAAPAFAANSGSSGSSGTPVTQCSAVTPVSGNSTANLSVAQFDPAGGTLTSATLSLKVTETYQANFLNGSTFAPEPSAATLLYIGADNFIEAGGPGLGTLPDTSGIVPPSSTPLTGLPLPGAFSGSPGTFLAAPTALPTLLPNLAGAEGRSAVGASTDASAPSDWTALGFPWSHMAAPISLSNAQTFTTQSATVPVGSLSAWTGTGNVTVPVVSLGAYTIAFSSATNQFGGTGATPQIQACVTYGVLASALPEVPTTVLLPAVAGGIVLASFAVTRRRRKVATA